MAASKTFRSACVALSLGTAGVAAAQDISDLQPAPVGGAPRFYLPGGPLPSPDAVPTPAATPARPGDKPAETGRIILGDRNETEVEAPPEMSSSGGDTYVVRRGDTLWSISSAYLKSPWAWPKLWAFNPSITNPHWIYPGDVLHLAPPRSDAAVATPTPTPKPVEGRHIDPAPAVAKGGLRLHQSGFVEPGELALAGIIVGSKEEKIMLAKNDEAYVEFKKSAPLVVGQKYTVYKPTRPVIHPVTGKRLGDMVEILGEAEVRTVTDGGIARVFITDSINPMERGFRVGPLRKQFLIVDPRPASKDLIGVVVDTMRLVQIIGAQMLVFIDQGRQAGVEVGNRFQVVRRGDGYQPVLSTGPIDDPRFPRELIGDILVIDLRDGIATGIVTRSDKEVRVGDRVELRAGR